MTGVTLVFPNAGERIEITADDQLGLLTAQIDGEYLAVLGKYVDAEDGSRELLVFWEAKVPDPDAAIDAARAQLLKMGNDGCEPALRAGLGLPSTPGGAMLLDKPPQLVAMEPCGVTDHPPHEDSIEALAALRWRTIGQQHYGDFDPETETRDLVAECKAEMADVWNYGNMLATAGTITAAQRDQLHRRLREAWAVVAASVAQGAGTARRGL